jgi:excisionase family DNA binding protein
VEKRKRHGQPFQEAEMSEKLLTPGEVAELFKVNPKTVTRWARAGKITAIRTLGGHRRFDADEIRTILDNAHAAA